MSALRDASEVQVGRITNDRAWDRRYRIRHAPPEPIELHPWREALRIIGLAAYLLVLFGSIIFFAAYFAAAQIPAPIR